LQNFCGNSLVDPQRAKRDALLRRPEVEGRTLAVVATDVAVGAAVAHVQLAAAVRATQQPGQQCVAATKSTAGHAATHVGVVGDHALVALVSGPVNVAVVMLVDQALPVLTSAAVATHEMLATVF